VNLARNVRIAPEHAALDGALLFTDGDDTSHRVSE
jgi:hypothetical protein